MGKYQPPPQEGQNRAASPSSSSNSNWISLDVGDRIMRAPRCVLEKSTMLKHALSRISNSDVAFDFYVDANIFKHILDYLRNDTFPLFWTKSDGFDFVLYQRVQQDAEFFHLWELRDWIHEQKYLQAVKVVYEEIVETHEPGRVLEVAANVDVERRVVTRIIQTYNCPRGVAVHRVIKGVPLVCGKECKKALGDRGENQCYKDVPKTEVITMKKTYVFNSAVLAKQSHK